MRTKGAMRRKIGLMASLALGLVALGACKVDAASGGEQGRYQTTGDAEMLLAAGDYEKAHASLLATANQDNAAAMVSVGELYAFGRGVPADADQARHWYERAAALGNARAEYRLGEQMLDESSEESRERTLSGALPWMRLAANRGFPPAQYWMCLAAPAGAERPKATAYEDRQWCEKAAAQGHIPAAYKLAEMYTNGLGGEQNQAQALRWLRNAAEGGIGAALIDIEALVGEKDAALIYADYVGRAKAGEAKAQQLLGMMYNTGIGVPEDVGEGFSWSLRAAVQKDPGGAADAGLAYSTGQGVGQDHMQAYVWFSLAAAFLGETQIEFRDMMLELRDQEAAELSPDDLKRARRIVLEKLSLPKTPYGGSRP